MDIIEIIKAVVFGIVEGITEWLPISSTGHLILLNEWVQFNVCETPEKLDAFMEVFDVVIQLGAILAVVLIFIREIWPFGIVGKSATGKDWVFGGQNGRFAMKKDIFILWLKIIAACIPGLAYGVLLDDKVEALTADYKAIIVVIMLIVVGVLFILIENLHKNKKAKVTSINHLSYQVAVFIGIFQLIAAALPGTSRSGATIIAGLLLGLSRGVAAEFTFYLAIPTMFGASLLKVVKFLGEGMSFTGTEMGILVVSSIVAFVVSIVVIRFFMGYIRKHDFKVFGWYRIVLGTILLVYFLIR
ncbi:MAG TPA: undecaprenyl-diphosphate phosphatase [Lachnospiraceae bacterium]|nr:undecaprenyl-diphosphate phosphatase [Lachnospiraceae bacterium]HPF28868.1 undecaprenyl-diphosphate phosphatase [Lachnospiraceae bacterium]